MLVLERVARRYRRTWLLVTVVTWLVGAWALPLIALRPFPLAVLLHWGAFVVAPRLGYTAARRAIVGREPEPEGWVLCGGPPVWTLTRWGGYAPWLGLAMLLPVLSYAGYLDLPVILISWFAYLVWWVVACLESARTVAILRREFVAYRSQTWTFEGARGARGVVLAGADAERSEVSLGLGSSVAAEKWSVAGPMGALTEATRRLLDEP